MKNKKKQILGLTLSFIIPVCIMFIVFMRQHVAPFGRNTLVLSDMNAQYINYFSYFKSMLSEGNNFFYTFSKTLGGDMVGFSAYYLLSPFNLLLLLFPHSMLPLGVSVMYSAKIGFCGLSSYIFFRKKSASGISALLFSTAYALCGYNLAYCFNIMWLDGVIFLPLIALGIEKIVHKNKCKLYIASLAAAIFTNYYIGFMLCIFSVIYFSYSYILACNGFKDILKKSKNIGLFLISSLASAGLIAFLLLPILYSLSGGKAQFSLEALDFFNNFHFTNLFTRLYPNTYQCSDMVDGLPNIFCGVFTIVLVVLFFINEKISVKEKLLSAALIAVYLISFYINTFNIIWHGFNPPAWFPYRYSFQFSFILLLLACRSLMLLKSGIKLRHLLKSFIILLIATIVISLKEFSYLSITKVYYFSLLLAAKSFYFYFLILALIYEALLYVFISSKWKETAIILCVLLLQLGDLALNANHSISVYALISADSVSFKEQDMQIRSITEKIKKNDDGFYRMEKTDGLITQKLNYTMKYSFNGLSHSSSCEKMFVKEFMGKLGFRSNKTWAAYGEGTTASFDSFLGVKYIFDDNIMYKPYPKIIEDGDVTVYQNPYVLPIGFAINSDALSINTDDDNPFELQNKIFSSMAGETRQIYTPAREISIQYNNLNVSDSENLMQYEKTDENSEAKISYQIISSEDQCLYVYIPSCNFQNARIFVNGEDRGAYFDKYRWNIVSLGRFKKGDIINFEIQLGDKSLTMGSPYLYYENIDVLEDYIYKLREQTCDLDKISSSHLKGDVKITNKDYLLFTIPYENAWHIKIDGQSAESVMIFDGLMAVPITPGEHTVDLRYIPNGLYAGIGISVISLAAIIFCSCRKKRKAIKGEEIG